MVNVSTIVIISCQRHPSVNPVITQMQHLTIIVNSFWMFAVVAKSPILNVVGFLDPSLDCDRFAAKAVGWFKPKRIHVYLTEKYLNKLEKHILDRLILSNLQH